MVVGSESVSPLKLRRWEPCDLGRGITVEIMRLNALAAAPYRTATQVAAQRMIDIQADLEAAQAAVPPEPTRPADAPQPPPDGASEQERTAYEEACAAFERAHPEYMAGLRLHVQATMRLAARSRELSAQMLMAYPTELIERAFRDYVRKIAGVELDGQPITSGAELLEVADEQLISAVLSALRRLFELSSAEGKASASLSMSSAEAATHDGASGAPSTAVEAGQLT